MAVSLSFSPSLASLIYGGSDIFLMPSRFEPCGLGQLIALRYGSVPLVRHTGGLADTVRDVEEHPEDGNGFVFKDYQPEALLHCLLRALRLYSSDRAGWRQLMIRGMGMDFSWSASAQEYIQLYQKAIQTRQAAAK
jgi:starch synthase